MKQLILGFLVVTIVISLISCSCESRVAVGLKKEESIKISKTKIVDNLSKVELIIKKLDTSGESFSISGTVLKTEETDGMPGLAVTGTDLELLPNFYRDESGKIISTDERNKNINELSRLKKDSIVILKIKLSSDNKWYIMDFIK